MLSNYFSEEEVAEFRVWMDWADDFAIVSHVSPDGDSVGSSLAMASFLQLKGKKARVVLPDAPPSFLEWLPGMPDVVIFEDDPETASGILQKADVICCLDFNVIGRVKDMASSVLYSKAKKILIDHHLGPSQFCDIILSRPNASSTSELLFHFLCALGEWNVINRQISECICTGMMTDTGAFTYNSNDPQFFFIMSKLMEKDVDKDSIYRRIYHNFSEQRLRLSGYVLTEKMEILPGSRVALITLSQSEMKRFCCRKGDTEGFVNMPLQISGILFSAFLKEESTRGVVKISLRSVGSVPSNLFASKFFNGGGHRNASGGEFEGTLQRCVRVFKNGIDEWRKSDDEAIRILFDPDKR